MSVCIQCVCPILAYVFWHFTFGIMKPVSNKILHPWPNPREVHIGTFGCIQSVIYIGISDTTKVSWNEHVPNEPYLKVIIKLHFWHCSPTSMGHWSLTKSTISSKVKFSLYEFKANYLVLNLHSGVGFLYLFVSIVYSVLFLILSFFWFNCII